VLSQSAFRIRRSAVQQQGQGYFEKLSYKHLYGALDAGLGAATDPDLHEFMEGYKTALQGQERAKTQVFGHLGDPNG